jgi:hypothetical protein
MRVVSDQNGPIFIPLCHTLLGTLFLSVLDPDFLVRIRILLFRSFRIRILSLKLGQLNKWQIHNGTAARPFKLLKIF